MGNRRIKTFLLSLGVAVVSKEPHIFSLFHTLKYVLHTTYFKYTIKAISPSFNKPCCMNVRIWRHALEPLALKGVSPQKYAIRYIGREQWTQLIQVFHYIKYISHGHIGLCYRYTGAYPPPFPFSCICAFMNT